MVPKVPFASVKIFVLPGVAVKLPVSTATDPLVGAVQVAVTVPASVPSQSVKSTLFRVFADTV